MTNNKSSLISISGFSMLLTLVFIAAKLFGKIAWSWWWVLSPLWICFALFLLTAALLFVCAVVAK